MITIKKTLMYLKNTERRSSLIDVHLKFRLVTISRFPSFSEKKKTCKKSAKSYLEMIIYSFPAVLIVVLNVVGRIGAGA